VLYSSIPRITGIEEADMAFPATGLFPGVLVKVKLRGMGEVYLNDTNQYAALGATGHDRTLGLDVRRARPHRILAADDKRSFRETAYDLRLDGDGKAHITRTVRYYGGGYAANHRKFSEMPPEERRRYHQEVLSGLSQGAEADGDPVTEFGDYPGIETVSATIPDFAVRDGDFLYFSLPASLRNLLGLRSDTRSGPLYWGGHNRFRIRTTVQLPPEFREAVLLPEPFFWSAPGDGGTVWVGIEMAEDGRLELIHDVDLQPTVLPPDAYQELLGINRQLSHPDSRTVLLRRAP
jgi:hypothetical protein